MSKGTIKSKNMSWQNNIINNRERETPSELSEAIVVFK